MKRHALDLLAAARDQLAVVGIVLLVAVFVANVATAQRTGERSGVSRTECQSVTTAATQMQPASGARFRAWGCVTPVNGTTGVYVVDPTDANTSEGRGPFCDDAACHTYAFSNETSEFYLMAASGTVNVCCEYEME